MGKKAAPEPKVSVGVRGQGLCWPGALAAVAAGGSDPRSDTQPRYGIKNDRQWTGMWRRTAGNHPWISFLTVCPAAGQLFIHPEKRCNGRKSFILQRKRKSQFGLHFGCKCQQGLSLFPWMFCLTFNLVWLFFILSRHQVRRTLGQKLEVAIVVMGECYFLFSIYGHSSCTVNSS